MIARIIKESDWVCPGDYVPEHGLRVYLGSDSSLDELLKIEDEAKWLVGIQNPLTIVMPPLPEHASDKEECPRGEYSEPR